MKKAAAFIIFFCLFTINAHAGEYILPEDNRLEGNLAKCEDYIQNDGIIMGDGMFFSRTLNGGGAIGGDLLGVFGTAKINTVIGGNLRLISGGLFFNGSVNKNATALSGTIKLEEKSEIGGGVYLAGGEISLKGKVGANSYIAAREVIIDGKITGDIYIYTGREGRLYINEGAVISGNVHYFGNNAFVSPKARMNDFYKTDIFNKNKDPYMFILNSAETFFLLLFMASVINLLRKNLFFKAADKIKGGIKYIAKSFFFLLLILFSFLVFSVLIYFLIPLGLSPFFCIGVSLIFLGTILFLFIFSFFPVACLIGRLITKKESFLSMLLGFFLLFLTSALFKAASFYQPLFITSSIFCIAFKAAVFMLGSGAMFSYFIKKDGKL